MWKTIFQSNEWPKNTRDFTETYYRGSMPGESRKRPNSSSWRYRASSTKFVIVAMFRCRCSPECHSASICSVEHESLSHPRNHGAMSSRSSACHLQPPLPIRSDGLVGQVTDKASVPTGSPRYTALRRPLRRLMTSTTSARTSKIWINPPNVYELTRPSNHRTSRITKIVQSIVTSSKTEPQLSPRESTLLIPLCSHRVV